ncbi:MAG: hypothetical protein LUQ64_03940, partial [Methanomicrobiales archaeon]|nr:hypothetical protein [Methanomicrobiales archaeon]
MHPPSWPDALPGILDHITAEGASVDRSRVSIPVSAYLVPEGDGSALQFSIPVQVGRNILEEFPLDPAGAEGAVAALIEHLKRCVPQVPDLGPLAGAGTRFPGRYRDVVEPYTVIHSPSAMAEGLWKADHRNVAEPDGLHLNLRGALPYPGPAEPGSILRVTETLESLLAATAQEVFHAPPSRLEEEWRNSLDQKGLRDALPALGLVSFIGDSAQPARGFTHLRCFPRVAGPKEGVSVPFRCPPELGPVEVGLVASGTTLTGLGIRRKEVVAIAGSNAEGKSTLLQAVWSGQDDHLGGDGREHIVTVPGVTRAEAGYQELGSADVSLFFRRLPPGLSGTPAAVSGQGSASLVMAQQLQHAIRVAAPLCLFDEDSSAPNLLVPSCVQGDEVRVLSRILATQRGALGETALLFAAGALDILVARADRILILEGHAARAMDPAEFRRRLAGHLAEVMATLGDDAAEHAIGSPASADSGNRLSSWGEGP